MPNYSELIRNRIKAAIGTRFKSQKEFAEKAGIAEASLIRALKDDSNPELRTLEKVAETLGLSLPQLLTPPEEEPKVTPLQALEVLRKALEESTKPIEPKPYEDILEYLENASEAELLVVRNSLGLVKIPKSAFPTPAKPVKKKSS